MPTNHSSFLKMIGLDNESEQATDEQSADQKSPEEQAPADDFSATGSATEWDPERLSQRESTELESFEQEFLNEGVENGVEAELASVEDADTNVEGAESSDRTEPDNIQRVSAFANPATTDIENRKTNLSKISVLSRISRLISRSVRAPIDYENAMTNVESKATEPLATATLSASGLSPGALSEDSMNSQSINEVNELDQNSELNELMKSANGSTRKTVPFDYDHAPTDDSPRTTGTGPSFSGTAHFDYSESSGVARVVVLEGKVSAKAFHLGVLPLRIGRDPLNEIVIDDTNVSRYHAEIQKRDDKILIVDVGSTNGVKVNGQLVQEAELKSHDIVQIGEAMFEFLDPGVISHGVLQAAAVEAAAPKRPARSKKKLWFALAIIFAAGAYLFSANRESIQKKAANESRQMVLNKVESELGDLRGGLEKMHQKPIVELAPEEVKKAFLSKVDQSLLSNFIPRELREKLVAVPAEIIKVMVEDPKLMAQIVASGASADMVQLVLRGKLADLAKAGRFSEALVIVKFLSASNPSDEKLKKWMSQLEARVTSDSSAEVDAQSKTQEILKSYETNFETLLERGRVKEALDFAKRIHANALDAMKKFPQYAEFSKAEAAAWAERMSRAEAAYADYQKAAAANDEAEKAGEELLQDINSELDFANVTEAKKLIEEFVKKYPMHTKVGEVLRLKKQLEDQMGGVFSATKQSVETLIRAEAYENAWTELYRFLDQAPDNPQALELKMSLDRMTAPRATQYYNQARVFEFEADDLVAAEQYYKKTLDSADPRGELYKKAKRRYDDVKRKGIH